MTIDERLDGLAGELLAELERQAPLFWASWNLKTFRENRQRIRAELIADGANPELVDAALGDEERRLRTALRDEKEKPR